MPTFFAVYMSLWILACISAMVLMLRLGRALALFQRDYWRGLFQGWKLLSFAIAAAAFIIIAPYSGDPTWDYIDAAFMSVLTYLTAPWAVGTCYLAIRRQRPATHAWTAICVWLFSASWSYDLYILLRDGDYPLTWMANIFASSLLYLSAGLMWSLESVEGRGVIFGFMDPAWPSLARTGALQRVLWYALPFLILVTAMILPFLS